MFLEFLINQFKITEHLKALRGAGGAALIPVLGARGRVRLAEATADVARDG